MPVELVAVLAVTAFIGLMLLEVPVAFSLMAAGTLGIILMGQWDIAFSALSAAPFSATSKYALLVLPMFILLGSFVSNAGIAEKIFTAADRLVGWMPGGLAVATVVACTVFGGISGSSAADVATLGRISVTEMRRHGYSAKFAAGVVANAGTIAILVPPSIPLIVYAILTGLPIGQVLLAGIVPGIFSSLVFSAYVVGRAIWLRRTGRPEGVRRAAPERTSRSLRGSPEASDPGSSPYLGLFYALLLFTVIAGGIYSGLFTSTEAAAVGAFTAMVIALVLTVAQRQPVLQLFRKATLETAAVTSMIFALLIGTSVFTYFLSLSRLPIELSEWAVHLNVSRYVLVAIFLLLLVPLGMLLDGLSILLLVVPVAYPILTKLGIDGIWLGILIVTIIELGLILPPIGINVFVIAGLVDDLSVEEAFAGSASFIWVHGVITVVLFCFPELVLFLPRLAHTIG